jgi:ureidoacrylate peracid hydrolase
VHDVGLPQHLIDELKRNAARERFFATILAPRAALVVVDMQNHWVSEQGIGHVQHAQGVVPQINILARTLREGGGVVAWVRSTFTGVGRSAWPMLFEQLEGEMGPRIRAALSPSDPMHEFWHGLDIDDRDLIIDKDRFSAFAEGASDLEAKLRTRSIDTIIVTGCVTNICCDSTARDAMMRDFRTIMVSDANAARTDDEHVGGLVTFAKTFGAVMTTAELVSRIEGEPSRA